MSYAIIFVAILNPMMLLLVFKSEEEIIFLIFSALYPATIPLIAINGLVAVFKGYIGRWTFFLGSILLSGSLVVKVLSYEFSTLISSREVSLVPLYAIALEAVALALTMLLQVRHLRLEKEQALQEQVLAAQDKLKMAQQMLHAAHDIQQPLSSLRMALSSVATDDDKERDFHQAIDCLEEIVKRQLDDAKRETAPLVHDHEMPQGEAVEPFPARLVLDSMAVMFPDEAASRSL